MGTVAARSPWTIGAAATAFLLPIAYSPSVYATFWSPKAAVLLVAGSAGLTRLPALVRGELRATTFAALTFVAVATLSTALSPHPLGAIVGLYNWGTGLAFVVCLVGVWALGVAADRDDPLVTRALVLGCAVSAGVGLTQALIDLPFPALAEQGRATGLAGNAVHLGTVACIGLAICAWRDALPLWVGLGGITWFIAATQVSGTRTALVVAIALAIGLGWLRWRRGIVLVLAATSLGFLLGSTLASHAGFTTATARATDERALAAASGGGVRVRFEVWAYARHAITERPVVGHGPGRFRAATSADRTLAVVQAEGPAAIYSDAHNLIVEHLVTTGALGAAALSVWLVLAVRRARGVLLWAGGAGLALATMQPQSVGTTPLYLLALGTAVAAARPPSRSPSEARRRGVLTGAAIGAGVVLALTVLVGDVALLRARDSLDVDQARRADLLLRPWPKPATIRARAHAFVALQTPDPAARRAAEARALYWRRVAAQRDPTDPEGWFLLADDERAAGMLEQAAAHYQRALVHDPFHVAAMRRLADMAVNAGDRLAALQPLERIQAVVPSPALTEEIGELRSYQPSA